MRTFIALIIVAAAAAEDAPLVAVDFGEGATVIGTAATIDGRRCCELHGTVAVPLAAWWKDGARPPKDQAFAAEVVFKDTAAAPIRVQAFAGLPGRWDLSRIGGEKDGQWKTARIPLPWDYVMRTGDGKAELAFIVPGDDPVAVASLHIVKSDAAADEVRWDAEMRAWLARTQGEARAKAKLPPAEKALPPTGGDASVYIRPYARLIQATSAPQPGEAGAPIKLTLARGEIEPGQFGVYAVTGDLKNVRVAMGSLKEDTHGDDSVPRTFAGRVELLAAEFCAVSDGSLFPQHLWPAYPVDVPKERSHPFWIEVEAPQGHPAGTWRGEIAVTADGGFAAKLPVEVQVLPIDLLSMHDAELTMGPCAGWHPAHEVAELARENHNGWQVWYSSFAPGIVTRSATDFDLDFAVMDDFMANAKAAGVERVVWFLGGDPYGFPDTCHLERELYRQVHAQLGSTMAPRLEFITRATQAPDALLPELVELYKKWVTKVMAHAEEKAWPEIVLTPFDEPAKWIQDNNGAELIYYKDKAGHDHVDRPRLKDLAKKLDQLKADGIEWKDLGKGGAGGWLKPHFKECCALIHQAWPKARVYGSIHHAEPGLSFIDDIDIFCTNAIAEDHGLGDKVRAKDHVFWQYPGCGDHSDAARMRYVFGWYYASFDSRGSLVWAYDAGNFWDSSSGENSVYGAATPYGVVRSPCFIGIREAWDDRRYLETLRAAARKAGGGKPAEIEAFIHDLLAQAALPKAGQGRDTAEAFYERVKDPDALEHLREQVRAKILSLQ